MSSSPPTLEPVKPDQPGFTEPPPTISSQPPPPEQQPITPPTIEEPPETPPPEDNYYNNSSNPSPSPRSRIWYILLIFGSLGSIIGYYAVRRDSPRLATSLLLWGHITGILLGIIMTLFMAIGVLASEI